MVLVFLCCLLLLPGCFGSGDDEPVVTSWKQAPVIPEFDDGEAASLRQQVLSADQNGMRDRVFAKIGDSNTDFPANLFGLGCREPKFGENSDLASTWRRYREGRLRGLAFRDGCGPANPFSRNSAAATPGAWSGWLLTRVGQLVKGSTLVKPAECQLRQTPLACELGLIKPRFGLIMIGSGDVLTGVPLKTTFREDLERIVEETRAHGTVPILSTLPPMNAEISGESGAEKVELANSVIAGTAERLDVPLINVWRAMKEPGMENDGLRPDDVHLSVLGPENADQTFQNSVNLTDDALRFGANRRNLIWLQVLRELDRVSG